MVFSQNYHGYLLWNLNFTQRLVFEP